MGMYDSVVFKCPNCGNVVEAQSKGGKCLLQNFSIDDIPPEIAFDLNNSEEYCYHCNTTIKLKIEQQFNLTLKPVIEP